jgi:hypothetical protein
MAIPNSAIAKLRIATAVNTPFWIIREPPVNG